MNYNFKNLVFEGGGVKGIAYGGALEELEKRNILTGITRVAGTSAGAINACLLALGYSYKEVSDIIAQTDFKSFEDSSIFPVFNISRFVKEYGWFKGDKFSEWISQLIKNKTGNADLTFRELAEQAAGKGYRSLYVVNTNLTKQRSDILSHETTPDMPIKMAIRMSMSIPLFFQSIELNKDIIVDGGVAWNYPVNIFDNQQYIQNSGNGIKVDYNTDADYLFNYETLGFRLGNKTELQYDKQDWSDAPVTIGGLPDYIKALIIFLMEAANKRHLHENDWNRSIFIDSLNVKATDFDLPKQKVQTLLQNGRQGTIDYFNWRDADANLSKLPL